MDLSHTGAPSVRGRMGLISLDEHQLLQTDLPLQLSCQTTASKPSPISQLPSLPPLPSGSNYKPVTSINPEHLLIILEGTLLVHELYVAIKSGFCIPHFPSPWKHPICNHKSACKSVQNPQFMEAYIAKELAAGCIVGPFTFLPLHCIISPSGLVLKHEAGTFHVIHNLSFPKGQGVNDLIPNHLATVQYEHFEHAVGLIRQAGRGALLS